MNRRLQQFLELEQLTPSRLAEVLGIQRSGLSHILSGRNKPSYDFINRFLSKYPQVNAEWLITGKGKPYKQNNEEIPFDFNENPEIEIDNNPIDLSYPPENSKSAVKRITLFFQDGSFEEFYPSK